MHKILIANRGEIARRIARTCREMGLASVAVFSEADRSALFVAEADEAVALGGNTPGESYLRIDAILEAARRTGADAVHPGYGFLAENADFARAVADAGLTLIGPPVEAIQAMGSKIEAKRRMQEADVPVLPSVDVTEQSEAELVKAAEKLGWPVLIKASAGGGGRGMRIVRNAGEFSAALEAARNEAQSAFGDETVFMEPYVEAPRHVEIQIFGDQHGNLVSLFERECSVQRRHQKILEESPSVAVDAKLRQAMGEVAVRAGKAIGYVGAGTVEFLLTPDGKFYFLEVNTRLQVEHPVTECITGLDLVRLQILVARGEPLPPDALDPALRGHSIEVRLYAEDPQRDFQPQTGRLHRFRIPEGPGVRVDSGFEDGAEISPFYDSLLAKVIVHAPTRDEAARRLAVALRGAEIHGVQTNRELLVRLLEHPEFLEGKTDTHFLERHSPVDLGAPLADRHTEQLHAAVAALAAQAQRHAQSPVLRTIPSGWRNNPSMPQQAKFEAPGGDVTVEYRWDRDGLLLVVDGEALADPRVNTCTAERVQLEIDGVQRTFAVHCIGNEHYVQSPLGVTLLREVERFPDPEEAAQAGTLTAPFPGVVTDVKVAVGDNVEVGDTLLVIESMKMLHSINSPTSGKVTEVRVEPKSHVEMGMVLAVIDEPEQG